MFSLSAGRVNRRGAGGGVRGTTLCLFVFTAFRFLPYPVGREIGTEHSISLYDAGLNDDTEKIFTGDKPAYMIGMKKEMNQETSRKIAVLHQAYRNGEVHLFAGCLRKWVDDSRL